MMWIKDIQTCTLIKLYTYKDRHFYRGLVFYIVFAEKPNCLLITTVIECILSKI